MDPQQEIESGSMRYAISDQEMATTADVDQPAVEQLSDQPLLDHQNALKEDKGATATDEQHKGQQLTSPATEGQIAICYFFYF